MVAALSACLCEALETDGAGAVCWCGLYPGGDVGWDYCGECSGGSCGMGYVQVRQVFPSSTFPAADQSATCTSPLAVTLAVGAVRCVPVGDAEAPPSADEMGEAGLAIIADMGAIRSAIACCLDEHVLGSWSAAGPRGGCAGGEWEVTVAVDGWRK